MFDRCVEEKHRETVDLRLFAGEVSAASRRHTKAKAADPLIMQQGVRRKEISSLTDRFVPRRCDR